jgi:hypothetical protein
MQRILNSKCRFRIIKTRRRSPTCTPADEQRGPTCMYICVSVTHGQNNCVRQPTSSLNSCYTLARHISISHPSGLIYNPKVVGITCRLAISLSLGTSLPPPLFAHAHGRTSVGGPHRRGTHLDYRRHLPHMSSYIEPLLLSFLCEPPWLCIFLIPFLSPPHMHTARLL